MLENSGLFRSLLLALPLAGALGASAMAQDAASYPNRTIRLVIPFAAGGATDAVARPWAERFREKLKASLIVENLGGAGGAIGAANIAKAPNDGYHLLIGSISTQILTPSIANPSPYDSLKDFEPIAMLVSSTLAIAVHPAIPARTLGELTAFAKANPGRISYGTPGAGSLNHLVGELYKTISGAEGVAHVPYRGGGPALSDLLGGQLPMIVPVMTGQIIALHQSGKLRLLVVTSQKRLANLPDVPTGAEAGAQGLLADGFYGFFAPAGTSRAIVERLAAASNEAMKDQELQKILRGAGFEPVLDSTPARARQIVEENLKIWPPVIARTGLKR